MQEQRDSLIGGWQAIARADVRAELLEQEDESTRPVGRSRRRRQRRATGRGFAVSGEQSDQHEEDEQQRANEHRRACAPLFDRGGHTDTSSRRRARTASSRNRWMSAASVSTPPY